MALVGNVIETIDGLERDGFAFFTPPEIAARLRLRSQEHAACSVDEILAVLDVLVAAGQVERVDENPSLHATVVDPHTIILCRVRSSRRSDGAIDARLSLLR